MSIRSNCLFNGKVARHTATPARQTAGRTTAMVILLLASSLLTGCSLLQKIGILSTPAEKALQAAPLSEQPYQLNLKLSATADLNPDTQSRPSPVQIRIFVVDAQSELGNKGFEEMFDFAGNNIEPRPLTTMTIRPGQIMDVVLPAKKSQTLVVIAAAYRDPFQSLWKAIAVVTPQDVVDISASVGANAVTIKPNL